MASLVGEDFAEINIVGLLNGMFATPTLAIAARFDEGRLDGFMIWDTETNAEASGVSDL